jgi:hypothetical protein
MLGRLAQTSGAAKAPACFADRACYRAPTVPYPTPPPAKNPEWGKTPGPVEERQFLQGPQERRSDMRLALKVFREFIHGFRVLHFVGPCVTVSVSCSPRPGSR